MSAEERDYELAGALRRLPTPEHAPEFWPSLDQRLGAEASAGGGGRGGGRRPGAWWRGGPLLVVAAAVLLIAAIIAAVVVTGGSSQGDQSLDAGPKPAVRAPSAAPEAVRATVTLTEWDGATRTGTVTVFADGSFWEVVGSRAPDTLVYDAERLSLHAAGGEGVTAYTTVVSGLPPALARFRSLTQPPGLAAFVDALAAGGDDRIEPVEVDGRPAWRYSGTLEPNEVADGPDEVRADVDQVTLLVLRLEERRDGRLLRTLELSGVEPYGGSLPPRQVGTEPLVEDAGYRRVAHQHAPEVPVPDGYARTLVAKRTGEGDVTGMEGSNPVGRDVLHIEHRNGFRWLAASSRTLDGGDDERWSAPFVGEGTQLRPERVDGVETALHPEVVPHAWAAARGRALWAAGTERPEVLAGLVRSMLTYG